MIGFIYLNFFSKEGNHNEKNNENDHRTDVSFFSGFIDLGCPTGAGQR
jgi:hypothetical protein